MAFPDQVQVAQTHADPTKFPRTLGLTFVSRRPEVQECACTQSLLSPKFLYRSNSTCVNVGVQVVAREG
jgi:hypothetical protein